MSSIASLLTDIESSLTPAPTISAGLKAKCPRLYTCRIDPKTTGHNVISDASALDSQLMHRIRSGDRRAFGELVDLHSPRAWRIASRFLRTREDAEEAVQDAFAKVWTKAATFDPKKASFSTWYYTILTRQCLDRLRRQKPTTPLSDALIETLAHNAPSQEDELISNARQALVRQHIDALPERQKAALILCYVEGMSQADAARILHLHIKALEGLLHRAKLTLKQGLSTLYAQ